MAVDARKFKNGSICDSTGYHYSPSGSNDFEVVAGSPCGSGSYYSQGVIGAWNGSSYDYYYTYPSPTLNG